MEILFVSMAISEGIHYLPWDSAHNGSVMWNLNVFFGADMNKLLNQDMSTTLTKQTLDQYPTCDESLLFKHFKNYSSFNVQYKPFVSSCVMWRSQ